MLSNMTKNMKLTLQIKYLSDQLTLHKKVNEVLSDKLCGISKMCPMEASVIDSCGGDGVECVSIEGKDAKCWVDWALGEAALPPKNKETNDA